MVNGNCSIDAFLCRIPIGNVGRHCATPKRVTISLLFPSTSIMQCARICLAAGQKGKEHGTNLIAIV